MKTIKRALAVLLSVCMLLSLTAVAAYAEDVTPESVSIRIVSARATEVMALDLQTVARLELDLRVLSGSDTYTVPTFDKVDTNATIDVYDGLYLTVNDMLSQLLDKGQDDGVYAEALIATAKPVSIRSGVLTVDLFSKNGEKGAKMIAVEIDGFEGSAVSSFCFDIPYGILSDGSGVTNAGTKMYADVQGLQKMKLELPSLAKRLVKDFATGNLGGVLGKIIFILPIAWILAPILLNKIEKNAQTIYDVYGIDLHPLFADASKAVRRLLPYLIGSIF